MSNRLVIYFHYDPHGQVDETCRFAVCEMKKQASKIIFVTNGSLQPQACLWAQQAGLTLVQRENTGFDVGAYRDVLLSLGKDGVSGYDELVLMNCTLAGPVYPLVEIFGAMDARPTLDFWGLTRHYAMKSRRFKTEYGEVPEHIQSHFIAVRPRLFLSEKFWEYWQNIHLPQTYEQSVAQHEACFTRYFADLGYQWDTYVDSTEYEPYFVNPIMACPAELLAQKRCPFFKRRSFFTPYADELRRTDGMAALELYQFVKNHTAYPIEILLRDLLSTQPLTALQSNLHWHYTLPQSQDSVVIELTENDLQKTTLLDGEKIYCIKPPEIYTGTAAWYADKLASFDIAGAAGLFQENPLLGLVSFSLPLYPDCRRQRQRLWQQYLPQIKQEIAKQRLAVAFDEKTPLEALNGGGVLLRGSAFPQGLPPLCSIAAWWALPLLAQQNGFYSATVETAAQAAAVPDALSAQLPQDTPRAAAICLARSVKHALQNGEGGKK